MTNDKIIIAKLKMATKNKNESQAKSTKNEDPWEHLKKNKKF